MTRDTIIGVRIGLRLAATLLDMRALMMRARSKASRERIDTVKQLADEVHAMRGLYDPRSAD